MRTHSRATGWVFLSPWVVGFGLFVTFQRQILAWLLAEAEK